MKASGSADDDDGLERLLIGSRALEHAPESLVQGAIALWDRRLRPQTATARWRILKAVLAFDSAWPGTTLAPVRNDVAEDRHLTFNLDGRDVDMRIRRSTLPPGTGWNLSGQVLGEDTAGRILVRCGAFEAAADWSEQCEFLIERVPEGQCFISLQGADWDAVLPAFDLPPAP